MEALMPDDRICSDGRSLSVSQRSVCRHQSSTYYPLSISGPKRSRTIYHLPIWRKIASCILTLFVVNLALIVSDQSATDHHLSLTNRSSNFSSQYVCQIQIFSHRWSQT